MAKPDDRGLSAKLDAWMKQQGDKGDATERDAESRQPDYKPWAKEGGYDLKEQSKVNE